MPLRHWMQLALTSGLGPTLIKRIVEVTGSAERACDASIAQLQRIDGIGPARACDIHAAVRAAEAAADAELARTREMGVWLTCPDDAVYPVLLQSIAAPPPVLYVKGTLEPRDLNAVAIVGSRRCSYYGREQAERFAALLAGAAFTVVSGGARGVDSSAHRGALQHPHGRTIAVLGCGVDVVYPPENQPLFDQIQQRGAIVSEFPLGTQPRPDNFPRRNRLISGLSRGVLVVEADERSGALITARYAGEHGRAVFAIPGRVDNPLSAGPHQLIRDGALLTARLEDIIENLGPLPADVMDRGSGVPPEPPPLFTPPAPEPAPPSLTPRQQQVLAEMSTDPASVDQLVERSGLEAGVVLQELTFLSLKGLVRRIDGQTYALRTSEDPRPAPPTGGT